MEVAIMDGHSFMVLPHDVAAYVPVANLGKIIDAVEDSNWELVCILCNEDPALGPVSKFPPIKISTADICDNTLTPGL